jgi:hypothetical protein
MTKWVNIESVNRDDPEFVCVIKRKMGIGCEKTCFYCVQLGRLNQYPFPGSFLHCFANHFRASLSYDIIKAHGGELKVESKEGEGAEFVIQIPIA